MGCWPWPKTFPELTEDSVDIDLLRQLVKVDPKEKLGKPETLGAPAVEVLRQGRGTPDNDAASYCLRPAPWADAHLPFQDRS